MSEPITMTHEEMVTELRQHASSLMLPSGAEWPPPPPEPDPEPDHEGVLRGWAYEKGFGKGIADKQWWCAWAREWLDQRGVDEQRASAALATLGEFPNSHYYQRSLDRHGREWVDGMLQAAGLGDPTLINNDVELNC